MSRSFQMQGVQAFLGDLSYDIAPERWAAKFVKRVVWRVQTTEQKIALTFDDGPHKKFTPQLLKILQQHKVPATFFLIGKHVQVEPALAHEIVEAGHEVGSHTYTHQPMVQLENKLLHDEIRRTDQLLKSLPNVTPKFLRPPMGLFSKRVLDIIEEEGYKTVIGDVYPRDPHLPGKNKIFERVLRRTKNGSIIILHDGGNTANIDRSQTVWAVERLIPELLDRGYQFVTLSELI